VLTGALPHCSVGGARGTAAWASPMVATATADNFSNATHLKKRSGRDSTVSSGGGTRGPVGRVRRRVAVRAWGARRPGYRLSDEEAPPDTLAHNAADCIWVTPPNSVYLYPATTMHPAGPSQPLPPPRSSKLCQCSHKWGVTWLAPHLRAMYRTITLVPAKTAVLGQDRAPTPHEGVRSASLRAGH
jgi:hypothetical protein